jgi:hypothetical protein
MMQLSLAVTEESFGRDGFRATRRRHGVMGQSERRTNTEAGSIFLSSHWG